MKAESSQQSAWRRVLICSHRSLSDTYWKNTFIPSLNPVNWSILLLALSLVWEPSFLFVLLWCFVLYSLMWFCYCKSFFNCQVKWMGPRSLHQTVSLPELAASASVGPVGSLRPSETPLKVIHFYPFISLGDDIVGGREFSYWSWNLSLILLVLFNLAFFFHMYSFSLITL